MRRLAPWACALLAPWACRVAGLREADENATFQDPLEDCLEVPTSICLQGESGASFVLRSAAVTPDLVLWYQFDKSLPVDDSGHWQHLTNSKFQLTPVVTGPGIMGHGGSAAFDGHDYRVVGGSDLLESPAFTVALWLYLREDSVGAWRTVFSRAAGPEELLPAMLLWPDERRLHVRASPRADMSDGVLDSVGHIPLRRWTHIAVTCTGGVLRLYINGLKDSETIIEGLPSGSGGHLYVGRDPWRSGTKAYLDDFRWYTRALSQEDVRALTLPSLTGMAADFAHLGCKSCTFTDAVRSCTGGLHLCSLQELFAGGFHTARAMGWLSTSAEVWYHNEEGADLFSGARKLGICCAD